MATLTVAMSFTVKSNGQGTLTVLFDHYVGEKILKLDTGMYKNELGQSYTITKFKYYIGNIRLKKANGGELKYDDYYLINEEEEESKRIKFDNIPAGEYTGDRKSVV